ncbi:hypothetical protein [Bradyrhizobium sp. CCBAU 53421]|uniref:hypothetical protein n=1 Tax=Bradyrhizobium sp. CCBAU 53421 TaxID=1325120 RepID=UPI00188A61BB|nr:hypothetical protein [Bradyrhizobium sp. CCBAU 53421]
MERESAARHQCECCGGIIDGLVDDGAIGLEPRIGLFTDACAFVCDECTASLIADAAWRRQEMVRRKSWGGILPAPSLRAKRSNPSIRECVDRWIASSLRSSQ